MTPKPEKNSQIQPKTVKRRTNLIEFRKTQPECNGKPATKTANMQNTDGTQPSWQKCGEKDTYPHTLPLFKGTENTRLLNTPLLGPPIAAPVTRIANFGPKATDAWNSARHR
jgi:hypothetical protein